MDSGLANRAIKTSVKNNDIDNVNNYCVNNFYDNFQIDACNNNSGHKTSVNIYDSEED